MCLPDIAELDTPKSADASSHGSPSASSALSHQDSGDTFYNASSGAFSGALHRVSSSGTDTSGGSGTEWFEAADYDSDTFGTASSAGAPLDVNGAVDDEKKGTQVALLLIQGVNQDRNFLQGPLVGSDESHASLRAGVSLHMREHGGTSLTSTGVHVRLFMQVILGHSALQGPDALLVLANAPNVTGLDLCTQGWVIVVARLQACMAVLEKGEVHPAARHSRDGVMEEHAEQRDGHIVTVAASGLLVELVANNHSGDLHNSPCIICTKLLFVCCTGLGIPFPIKLIVLLFESRKPLRPIHLWMRELAWQWHGDWKGGARCQSCTAESGR